MKKKVFRLLLMCLCLSLLPQSGVHAADGVRDSDRLSPDVFGPFLQGDPSGKYMGYIKFSIFLDNRAGLRNIVFQNSRMYPFHSDYLRTLPEFAGYTADQLDRMNLTGENRRVLMGTILFNIPPGSPQFELISESALDIQTVRRAKDLLLSASSAMIREVKYSPYPALRRQVFAQREQYRAAGIELVAFSSALSEIYSAGWAVGKVRLIQADALPQAIASGQIKNTDILVLDRAPREIPPVAGVLVGDPSVPSSHVALLSRMYDIPFAYQEGIFGRMKRWDGKTAFVQARESDGRVLVSGNVTAEDLQNLGFLKERAPFRPELNLSATKIQKVENLQDSDIPAYGSKAVRVGLLRRLLPDNSPEQALGIPVIYFKRYLAQARTAQGESLESFIARQLGSIEDPATPLSRISATLSSIRDTIKATPIPSAIMKIISARISATFTGNALRIKLRSSSNIEDREEFNGAGLYDSEGAWLRPSTPEQVKDSIEKALNKVWRSLYTERGYLARRHFKVDQSAAAMAVLVQPSFKGEEANGVAIIRRTEPYPGSYQLSVEITGFPGEDLSVTNPTGSEVPETVEVVIGEQYSNVIEMKLIRNCSVIPRGKTLLLREEYESLALMIKRVYDAWKPASKDLALDLEWKVMKVVNGKRPIFLKQVRPVPSNPKKLLPDGSYFYVFGGSPWIFRTINTETPYGYAALMRPHHIVLEMASFTQQDFVSKRINVRSISWKIQRQSFKSLNPTVEAIISPWEVMGTDTRKSRHYILNIAMSSPIMPSLHLSIPIFKEYEDEELNKKAQRVRSGSDLETVAPGAIWIKVPTQELLRAAPMASDEILRTMPYIAWPADLVQQGDSISPMPLYSFTHDFASDKLQLRFSGVRIVQDAAETMMNFRTEFAQLKTLTLAGLTSHPIVIHDQSAMAYAPGHHNYSDQYIVDLRMAAELARLPATEVKELIERHGRYLVLESKGSEYLAVAIKENGTRAEFGMLRSSLQKSQ